MSSFYSELKDFLRANMIDYLDLNEIASSLPIGKEDIYWRNDAHFSPAGNRVVAAELIKRWGKQGDVTQVLRAGTSSETH
jgi:hypothetical protein